MYSQRATHLSLVICTRNQPTRLHDTIKSVLQQTLLPNCIYIVNSGKPIESPLLKPNRSVVPVQEINIPHVNIGFSRNAVIKYLKTKYTMYVDDDVILEKSWINKAITLLSTSAKKIDVLGGSITGDGNYWSNCAAKEFSLMVLKNQKQASELISVDFLPTPAFLIKTKLLQLTHNPFALNQETGEDIIFTSKIRQQNFKLKVYSPLVCVHKFRHTLTSFYQRYYQYGRDTPLIWKSVDNYQERAFVYSNKSAIIHFTFFLSQLFKKLSRVSVYYWPGIVIATQAHHKGISDEIAKER